MNFSNIITVYLKELKDTLRDRRALMSTIIIPTVVIPALFFGVIRITKSVVSKAQEEVPTVAIIGGADSPGIVAALKKSPKLKIVPAPADWKLAIGEKRLRAAVEIPEKFEVGLKAGAAPKVRVFNNGGELKSDLGARALEKFLTELRDQTVRERLDERGVPVSVIRPFEFVRENVAPEKEAGNLFGGMVPYVIIILCFTGAMYPAMDITAGEKERGTMETLLCSPVARSDIVLGKFLLVLTGSLSAVAFSLISMVVTTTLAGGVMAGMGARAAAAATQAKAAGTMVPFIDPAGILGVLVMILPVAVLFSAVIFTVALFAKSYKEAQSYVAPMIFVIIMPAVVGMLPGIDLNARLALVPILNLSLVCKEMLTGVWHWNYIGIIFGSSCLYAGIALALAVRMFNREDVIFRT